MSSSPEPLLPIPAPPELDPDFARLTLQPAFRGGIRPLNAPTLEQLTTFACALSRTGRVGQSARLAGLSSATVTNWRKSCPEFRQICDEAVALFRDVLEAEVFRRAVTGVQKPVFYQGKQVATVTEYDSSLLLALEKAHDERFRNDGNQTNISQTGGVLVVSPQKSADEWAAATDGSPESSSTPTTPLKTLPAPSPSPTDTRS
jgi:hypothetical protein